MPAGPRHIRMRAVHGNSKRYAIRLLLRFNAAELGPEKTERLLTGLVAAIADVASPAECAEILRHFKAEQARVARMQNPERRIA